MYLHKIKRSPYYQLVYFQDGKRKTISTKEKSKSAAQKFLLKFKDSLEEKQIVKKLSLDDFRIEYEKYIESSKSKSYLKSVQLSFRQLMNFTGDVRLDNLTHQLVESFITAKYSKSKVASVLYYRTLKAALNKAVDWDYMKFNPLMKIKIPKTPKTFPAFIDEFQLMNILTKVEEQELKSLYIVAFHTGMRAGEIVNLKWNAVDIPGGKITVRNDSSFNTKSKKDRVIPMNKKVSDVLSVLKSYLELSKNESYVFVRKGYIQMTEDYISKKFKKAIRAADENEELHFHSLRHSFASNLVQRGVSIYVVKELLGHSDISTTMRYSHLNMSNLVEAVKKLDSEDVT